MTLNAKIEGFTDFLAFLGCDDTRLYHSQGGATEQALVAWRSWQRVSAEIKLLYAGPVLRWVTAYGQVNHLGAKPAS